MRSRVEMYVEISNLRYLTHRAHLNIGNRLQIIVTVYVKGRFRLNRVLLLVISLQNLLAITNQSKN